VATIARSPFVLLAHPSLGAKNMAELIELAKQKPGQIDYGSPGIGSMQQLTQELLLAKTGTKMMHVPYKGGGPAMTDLLAGHIPLLFSTTVQAGPFIKQGQVIPLAVTSPKRLSVLPDVPAIAETVPGFDADLWHAIVAPPGTPPAIVETLRTQIAKIVNSPMMQKILQEQGTIPYLTTTDEFKALIVSENTKWAAVVRSAGLRDTLQ
jgi:tripartite-type tricarboxylate transporter receptor subunit TctC